MIYCKTFKHIKINGFIMNGMIIWCNLVTKHQFISHLHYTVELRSQALTHCDLVTPYGDRDKVPSLYLNQCWLITSDINIREISQKMPPPSTTKIHLKITYLIFDSNFPGAIGLMLPLCPRAKKFVS